MTLKIPAAGEDAMLKDALGKTTPAALTLKLYTSNTTPADGDTAATYTEMSGMGYAAKTLAMATWTEAQSGGAGEATYAAQTWTFTAGGPITVYGGLGDPLGRALCHLVHCADRG
jgi:hypothetical protein